MHASASRTAARAASNGQVPMTSPTVGQNTTDALVASELELQLSFLPNETLVWQQGPAIGTGRFGQVILALRIPSAEFLAIKQIFIQEEFDQGNDTSSLCMQRVVPLCTIEREVEIVLSIQHPNIVQFVGCERYGPVYRIFMEYIPAGSLSKLLKELGPFQESAIRHFVRQLADGVAYLHRVGIAHRDLKCANLLLADDGTVKIADFGTAKRVATHVASGGDEKEEDEFTHGHETARSVREGLGSPYWMAPELVRAERGDDGWRKADVWGIGCVMVELATGKPPWDNHSNPLTAMFHIASKDALPPLPAGLSECARSFLLDCFDKNPQTRPSAAALLTHPFLLGETTMVKKLRSAESMAIKETAGPESTSNQEVRPPARSTERRSISSSSSSSSRPSHAIVLGASSSPSSPSSSSEQADSIAGDEEDGATYSSDDDEPVHKNDEEEEEALVGKPCMSVPSVTTTRRPSASTFTWTEIGRVRALADYEASDANELSLKEGRVLVVAGVNEFGWWRGKHEAVAMVTAEVGWFPCTYVEWIPGEIPFTVKKPHTPAQGVGGPDGLLLALEKNDTVHVIHCEWRDEQVWAFGNAIAKDGQQGWFPFACVVDSVVY